MVSEPIFAERISTLPLYPYRCTQCGHRFEKIQHFKDKPVKKCPKCGAAVERLLTAPGLQFKGSGWYVNDYAPKTSASSGDAADSGEKSAKKPDSKAETKPETKKAAGGDSGTSASSSSSPAPASGSSTT
jgi:putative FmdB family regulatory protein